MKSTTKVKIENSKMLKIRDFNEIFTCYLCEGYMIDPTTVENCGHTYCRSCILKYLIKSAYCPQCGSESKSINAENLASDNILRSVIYKMMPNIFQAEKQRQIKFYSNKKCNFGTQFEIEALNQQEVDNDFFMPTEPISLSLEYHPALLEGCQDGEIPAIRYLQCPASVQIQHLKRFLYSKFALDPHNDKITLEIIYEDEILPNNFMLMDVGYCYNWKREAPMRFMYRVMLYNESPVKVEVSASNSNEEPRSRCSKNKVTAQKSPKSVTFAEVTTTLETVTSTKQIKVSNSTKIANNHEEEEKQVAPVKVVIARKTSTESRKSSSKQRSHSHHSHKNDANTDEEPTAPTSNFISLRSNHIPFNDYTITNATTTTTNSKTKATTTTATTTKQQTSTRHALKTTTTTSSLSSSSLPQSSVVPIVVSIPQSQVANSPYAFDEQIDNLSLAQLKSACKKSPNVTTNSTKNQLESNTKNVPKLKIELSTLKTKLTIPKPKSADVIYDTKIEKPITAKKSKHRKHSLDESGPITDKVDLKTYAKNIGLKPIEVVTPNLDDSEKSLKYSPNASPMSTSSSSSTTCSSNGNYSATHGELGIGEKSSSSSHKKHKKKHSKESREPKESKRRKLHAEISSQPADESLKMKVKITTNPAHHQHSHKSHRNKTILAATTTTANSTATATSTTTTSTASTSAANNETEIPITPQQSPLKIAAPITANDSNEPKQSLMDLNVNSSKSKPSAKPEPSINMLALNKTLGEEAQSIKKLMRGEKLQSTTTKSQSSIRPPPIPLLPKPVLNIKEPQKLPTSPPLPPSLFKTMPLTFTTPKTSSSKPTNSTQASKTQEMTKLQTTTPTSTPTKSQTFAIPNPPARGKHFSAPSSIASSANKQAANLMQLKRSISLDDATCLPSKQQRLEQDRLMRKSIYGPSLASNLSTNTAKLLQQQFPTAEETIAPYYASSLTPYALTQPLASTSTGISSPPLSITKLNEALFKSAGMLQATSNASSSLAVNMPRTPTLPTLPALTQAQLNLLAANTAYQQQTTVASNNKTSMEILRLPSNSPTTSTETSTTNSALSSPKKNRLMGPPVSVANKSRKPAPLSPSTIAAVKMATYSTAPITTTQSTISQTNSASKKVNFRSSPPALINFRSALPLKTVPIRPANISPPLDANKLSTTATTVSDAKKSNGVAKPATKSLREFRPVSKDNSVDILDLSSATKSTQRDMTSNKPTVTTTPTMTMTTTPTSLAPGNSLEAALNKVKQSITACTVTLNSPTATTNTISATHNDELQNLHMLSESATAREKISLNATQATISTTSSTTLTNSLSNSFYEKPKQQSATLVRQQNASVRNIPNPSALAFRNQPPTTTNLAAAKITASVTATANSATTNSATINSATTNSAANEINTNALTKNEVKSPPLTLMTTLTSSTSPTSTLTSTPNAPTQRPTKKLTTIDQVAATLNARAASAAAAATTLEDSTSPKKSEIVATNNAAEKTTTENSLSLSTTNTKEIKNSAKTATKNSTPEASTTIANNSTKQTTATATTTTTATTAVKSVTPSPPPALVSKTTEAMSLKQTATTLNNNSNNNNNNTSSSNNNNNNNKSSNNNNKNNNLTPASTSTAPLSTPLSLSSSSLSSSSVSESNHTGLVVQGSV